MQTTLTVLALMAAATAGAQTNGYIFFAPGGLTSQGQTGMTLHTGGGADVIIGKGIGANVELGAMWPKGCFSDCVVGMLSPGGTYYFRHGKENKLQPFVNGGYSLMFRGSHENLFYFGGGANYWVSKKVGIRMEVRDHVSTAYSTAHFWGFRLGVSFR